MAVGLLLLATAFTAQARPTIIASFEAEKEVASWTKSGALVVERSTLFPSWAANSLRLFLPANSSGAVATEALPQDWREYQALSFFVYSQQPMHLRVELSDGTHKAMQEVALHQGANHVQLKLDGWRGLDMRQIRTLRFEPVTSSQAQTLFLDKVEVGEFNEILAKRGRMDIPYSMEVVTPHVPWAKPLAGGPLKVFIVPDAVNGRGAVELAQRLDSQLFAVTLDGTFGPNRWGFGDFYGLRGTSFESPFSLAYTYLTDALLNGPQYDVIVLPGTRPWEEMPEAARQNILSRVRAGAGLLLLNPYSETKQIADLTELSPLVPLENHWRMNSNNFLELTEDAHQGTWQKANAHYITRNVPFETFPFAQMRYAKSSARGDILLRTESGDPILAAGSYGKGRVVAVSYHQRGLIPLIVNQWQTDTTWHYWEYMYSLLARSTVWAAAKEPPTTLAELRLEKIPTGVAAGVVAITTKSEQASANLTIEATLRDESWETERLYAPRPIVGGKLALALPLRLRGGRHFLDVFLKRNGKTLDWGTLTFETPRALQIERINLSTESFKVGEPVTGELQMRGATGATNAKVQLSFFDNYGRLLATNEKPISGAVSSIAFSLSSTGCLSRLGTVRAEVIADGILAQRKSAEVFIRQTPKWDDYDIVMYLFGPDPAPGEWQTIQQQLKEMHVTTLSSYPFELSKHANFNVQAQTRLFTEESPDDGPLRKEYTERKKNYFATKDKKYAQRISCLNDPAYLVQEAAELKAKVTPWVPFSPLSYYIFEEPALTCYSDAFDICFSPFCMAKMRLWLKSEYGSLEALNAQWGTSFKGWDEVTPDATEEAQQRGNYSAWADHRTFMEKTYAGNYKYVRDVLHTLDPEGRVLLSGSQSSTPHNGCDYYQIDQYIGHMNPYDDISHIELNRSFNPAVRLSGGAGYGMHGENLASHFYKKLFHGYWAGSYIFWQYSTFDPDLTFSSSARDLERAFKEVKDGGIARLLKTASRDNNGIAVHYSYPSIHAAWIVEGKIVEEVDEELKQVGPTYRKFEANRDGWITAVQDLGLQFDFVANQQIEAGELLKRGFKVLVLPFSVALTSREVEEIKAFVNAGGTLIADAQAGVMDGHCKWLAAGSLDDVLGIARLQPPSRETIAAEATDRNFRLTSATALEEADGAALITHNRYGKGNAYYLNFHFNTYLDGKADGSNRPLYERLSRLFERTQTRPEFRAYGEGGRALNNFEQISYHDGAVEYAALLKGDENAGKVEPLKLVFPRKTHLYDVRQKRYLGFTDTINATIASAEPKLYALLPQMILPPQMKLKGESRAGQRLTFAVRLPGDKGMPHVARLQVFDATGKERGEYSRNLELREGESEFEFHVALNDPRGRWRVVATEAVSGLRGEIGFRLR
ncbi:MAG: beta-galactosidase trimerization domain-containing protein [Acidobacteria bacterium]|nr:beta-galactosidase trimerization domain-containing protein [Acidobacteriota bacterium]